MDPAEARIKLATIGRAKEKIRHAPETIRAAHASGISSAEISRLTGYALSGVYKIVNAPDPDTNPPKEPGQ